MIKKILAFSLMALVFSQCSYFRDLKQKSDSENYKPLPANVFIEFHLVREVLEEGFSVTYVDGTKTLYLSDKLEISNQDIAGFSFYQTKYGENEVGILFSEAGKKKFEEVTKQNINKQLAILLNKELISAPVIRQPINSGKAVLTLGYQYQKDEKTKKLMELFR